MRKLIPFMALMKEVYFILDIHLPKSEVFFKLSEDNKHCIYVAESNKLSPRRKILLSSIIIYEASYKIRLFGYSILIHKNKHRTLSLRNSTNNLFIYLQRT